MRKERQRNVLDFVFDMLGLAIQYLLCRGWCCPIALSLSLKGRIYADHQRFIWFSREFGYVGVTLVYLLFELLLLFVGGFPHISGRVGYQVIVAVSLLRVTTIPLWCLVWPLQCLRACP